MPSLLEPVAPDQARALLGRFEPIARSEQIALGQSLGRVLARDLAAPEPLPAFDRALMDGFAVQARDTFGASDRSSVSLEIWGEVAMGRGAQYRLGCGQAAQISTGGAMPAGADAVVMIENCRRTAGRIEVRRSISPGENVLRRGEDIEPGAVLRPRGRRLEPQDLVALAALGIEQVEVQTRPRVSILSTGDELVPLSAKPRPGQVRDANAITLCAQVAQAGGEPRMLGICPDQPEALAAAVEGALAAGDVVLISGGSSVGSRDWTGAILERFGPPGVLARGIAIMPGKPTLLAGSGGRPLIGLPGHPASSLVVTRIFVTPLIRALGGETGPWDPFPRRARATLARSIPSKVGREDWIRVALRDGRAEPLLKGSGAVSTVLWSDGLVRIPLEAEGVAAGDEVEVMLW